MPNYLSIFLPHLPGHEHTGWASPMHTIAINLVPVYGAPEPLWRPTLRSCARVEVSGEGGVVDPRNSPTYFGYELVDLPCFGRRPRLSLQSHR